MRWKLGGREMYSGSGSHSLPNAFGEKEDGGFCLGELDRFLFEDCFCKNKQDFKCLRGCVGDPDLYEHTY